MTTTMSRLSAPTPTAPVPRTAASRQGADPAMVLRHLGGRPAVAGPTVAMPAITATAAAPQVQRLGANPGCTAAERTIVHQAIFDARGWLANALPRLEATPVTTAVSASLRRNFGPTYGVAANIPLIAGRLRAARRELGTIPIGCRGAGDAICGVADPPCGYANGAGSHEVFICRDSTLAPGTGMIYRAGCALHEALHAAFANFTIDEYSGWHGTSETSATYPGAGTDPLLNADSYTTLVMDLS